MSQKCFEAAMKLGPFAGVFAAPQEEKIARGQRTAFRLPALFAFLHHVAAFHAGRHARCRTRPHQGRADALACADAASCRHGPRRGGWSVISRRLVRVFHLEKGASYYVHSVPFLSSSRCSWFLRCFSIYPTSRVFSPGAHGADRVRSAEVSVEKLRRIRSIIPLGIGRGFGHSPPRCIDGTRDRHRG